MKTCFGEWTLDADTRQLFCKTGEVPLSPKAFTLLQLLIESHPRALAKSDLHERLWPGTFVSDATLASLIAEIRRVLSDDARKPRFVRTVHRFGYAFCGQPMAQVSGSSRVSTVVACWVLWRKRRLRLAEGENILGREPEADISIDAPTISRRHARITIAGEEATVEDLASKNGTYVRGRRVTTASSLSDKDEIRLGSEALTFRIARRPPSTLSLDSQPAATKS